MGSTGEVFGIVPHECPSIGHAGSDDSDTDKELVKEARNAQDAIGENDAENDGADLTDALAKLTQSASWLRRILGREREVGPVKDEKEWAFFKEKILSFQGTKSGEESKHHSTIDFDGFTEFWNEEVDKRVRDNSDHWLTYKNVSLLKDAMKKIKKSANKKTTMLGRREQQRSLRVHLQQHDNDPMLQHTPAVEPTRVKTQLPTTQEDEHPREKKPDGDSRTYGAKDDEGAHSQESNGLDAVQNGPTLQSAVARYEVVDEPAIGLLDQINDPGTTDTQRQKRKRTRAGNRCRRCGKQAYSEEWRDSHDPPTGLLHRDGTFPHHSCRVDESHFEKGFPCFKGPMPRPYKSKKRNNKDKGC